MNATETSVLVALGSNLGARRRQLDGAVERLGPWVLDIPVDPGVRVRNPRDATLNFPEEVQ